MPSSLRELLVSALTSPSPVGVVAGGTRQRWLAAAGAMAVGLWLFAGKLLAFLALGTTSDLYQFAQLATTWLDGRFLQDNCYGNHLSIHTYLFCPVLAVLVVPFGAIGLLLALGLAAAAQFMAVVKILGLLRVPPGAALGAALLAVAMPLSVHVYQDDIYGFHVELLVPAMALWLAYFLLRRSWPGAIAMALVLLSVKEDSPLIVVAIALVVLGEDLVRAWLAHAGRPWSEAWRSPAALVALMGVVALPVLLLILKAQPVEGQSPGSFERLKLAGSAEISSGGPLFGYVLGHLSQWLGSPAVGRWFGFSLAATFGLILLRPHLVLLGLVTTLISWLMQQDLLWAPRFAPALAFFQVTGCLAFASAWQVAAGWSRTARVRAAGVMLAAVAVGIGFQLQAVPAVTQVYTLRPETSLSPAERRQADALFGEYRRLSRREEPVIASRYLFRYAHDRNLFWFDRLQGRPAPEWILWDKQQQALADLWTCLRIGVDRGPDDYRLVKRAGRFLLFRREPEAVKEVGMMPAVTGEADGMVRLRVRFPVKFAETTEPLLAVGPPGGGQVFFVRYLDDERLVFGLHQPGAPLRFSEPVAYDGESIFDLGFFCGPLLPEPAAPGGPAGLERAHYANLVQITCDGRGVLEDLIVLPRVAVPAIRLGANPGGVPGLGEGFTGAIIEARRGGYPALPAGVIADQGAFRLVVDLPGTTAGVPEPLLVTGVSGRAALAYIRLLPGDQAQVGVEFWGHGVRESTPFPLRNPSRVELVIGLPALYPPEGDTRWGNVPRADQERLRQRCLVAVNGQVRLDEPAAGPVPPAEIHLGTNPLGGSLVTPAFTGALLQASRQPPGRWPLQRGN